MSRKLFAFLLSELETLRIICHKPNCGAITELTIDRTRAKLEFGECPVCRNSFFGAPDGPKNPLTKLADALLELQKFTKSVEVEFVLPDESKSEAKKTTG
jgi:hypothetical protein